MSRHNHRLSYRKRREKAVARGKPAVRRRSDVQEEESLLFWKRLFAGVFLFPVAVISVFTIVEMLFRATQEDHFWRTDEFLFFTVGCLMWAGVYWAGWRPMRSYVFAHEFTHLLVAKAFGGKIYDWKVSAEGGYVETNKSNIWIMLGPYLLPFYTLVVLAVFGVVGRFVDMEAWQPLALGKWVLHYRWAWVMYGSVGFTWCYHLTFTAHTIHAEQGDLTRNGEFFSLMLIFIVNLGLIALLFVAASPLVDLEDVWRTWWGVAQNAWILLKSLFGPTSQW
jgi:hypothetical protein